MNSMRRRLLIMLTLILLSCQLMSAFWLWHESREQIGFLVNETLSAHSRTEHVENEIREAIASLLLPSLVMVCFTLMLSFWAISWIIRPLRALQKVWSPVLLTISPLCRCIQRWTRSSRLPGP